MFSTTLISLRPSLSSNAHLTTRSCAFRTRLTLTCDKTVGAGSVACSSPAQRGVVAAVLPRAKVANQPAQRILDFPCLQPPPSLSVGANGLAIYLVLDLTQRLLYSLNLHAHRQLTLSSSLTGRYRILSAKTDPTQHVPPIPPIRTPHPNHKLRPCLTIYHSRSARNESLLPRSRATAGSRRIVGAGSG